MKQEKEKARTRKPLIEVLNETSVSEHRVTSSSGGAGLKLTKGPSENVDEESQDGTASVEGKGDNRNGEIDEDRHVKDKEKAQKDKLDTEFPETENPNLDMVFKELCDPLVPVRGHGLIRLTHLVQRKDKCLKSRESAVLTIFLENLDHGDSYIYMAAINGLSAMCDVYPDLTVPKVCELCLDCSTGTEQRAKKRSTELRMKLGEILVKAARCLG